MATNKKSKSVKVTKSQLRKLTKKLENKALKLWSKCVRARAGNKCETCGATNQLNAHHLESYSTFWLLRYAIQNGVCACPGCHKFFKPGAWHRSFTFAYRHMTTKRKEDLDFLLSFYNDGKEDRKLTLPELEETIKYLESLLLTFEVKKDIEEITAGS